MAGVRAMGKLPPEDQPVAIELFRRGRVRHVDERNRELKHQHLDLRILAADRFHFDSSLPRGASQRFTGGEDPA